MMRLTWCPAAEEAWKGADIMQVIAIPHAFGSRKHEYGFVDSIACLLRSPAIDGYSREQAYVICSVAVDLRVSSVVNVPTYCVSSLLPEAIFSGD